MRGDLGAEFFQDLEVGVELADAEGAALGVGGQGELLHALQERREEEDGGAHAGGQFAVEAGARRSVEWSSVMVPAARSQVTRGALLGEEGDELLDVGDERDVAERDLGVGEERRAEDGQDGVLVARRRDGAAEGFAAVDDQIGHVAKGWSLLAE